jgi:two-component system, sensor histidine kinase ChiS
VGHPYYIRNDELKNQEKKMTDDNKQNEFLFKMSKHMRLGLAEVQKNVNALYRIEELEDYVGVKDSPIEYIQAALIPLVAQVNDFQDYAETVTGRMELDLQEVDIYAVLDGVMTIADQLIEQKAEDNITLEEDIAENLPTIEADPTRLSQVLLNLIHNAVKFTDKGYVTIRVSREPNNVLFEIRDTGIGIAEENQELVFEPFETILEDKNDPRLGFGIGLKTVEHIIDLHDGETWFESKAGEGSSFFFTIPI